MRVAGIRWTVEEGFQTGKGQVGLDHYQVRTWTGWHRFVTLAMLALAVLMAAAAAAAPPVPADPYYHARHDDPIALTAAEIRRLLYALVISPWPALTSTVSPAARRTQRWSDWRRRHQARARRSHYRRRLATETST